MGEVVEPFPISPVFQAPPSAVEVWVVPPLFFQATVCPTLTVAGLGEKDEAPLIPVMVIVRSAGVGAIGFDFPLLLQDARNAPAARKASTNRTGTNFFITRPPDEPGDLAQQDDGDAPLPLNTVLHEIDSGRQPTARAIRPIPSDRDRALGGGGHAPGSPTPH